MLRAKEHAPTPSPCVVFTFGLVVESIKELGSASLLHCLLSKACKSNVLEVLRINGVSSSNKNDSSEEEDVGETISSH